MQYYLISTATWKPCRKYWPISKTITSVMFSAWGNSVGYGPEPEEVINLLRRHEIPELMGNHELSLASDSYFKRMNPSAQKSISITRTLISGDTLGFIERLPACSIWHDTRCVHGWLPA